MTVCMPAAAHVSIRPTPLCLTFDHLLIGCALGETLTMLNGSPACFNSYWLSPMRLIHDIQAIYGLSQPSCCSSACCSELFCARCHANQLYQSTKRKVERAEALQQIAEPRNQFEIGLFSMGTCCSCLYACLCPTCAFAEARSALDGSPCCFNILSVPGIITTWLVHSAYETPYTSCSIFFTTFCCCPCQANRVYQTAKKRGKPEADVGRQFNTHTGVPLCGCPKDSRVCAYAFLCPRCFVADFMKIHLGMPIWMGLCCIYPWSAFNIMRYHYRVQGSDYCHDCFAPNIGCCMPPFTCFDWCAGLATGSTMGTLVVRVQKNPMSHSRTAGNLIAPRAKYLTRRDFK